MVAPYSQADIFNRSFNDSNDSLKVDLGSASISLTVSDIQIGAVELDDANGGERGSIKDNGVAISSSPNAGGLLIAGRNGGNQFHLQTDATGNMVNADLNFAATSFAIVTVGSTDSSNQGPALSVAPGQQLLVRFRTTQAGSPIGYVSNSAVGVTNSAGRLELSKGDAVSFRVSNTDLLFFSSDTSSAVFELVVEQ